MSPGLHRTPRAGGWDHRAPGQQKVPTGLRYPALSPSQFSLEIQCLSLG